MMIKVGFVVAVLALTVVAAQSPENYTNCRVIKADAITLYWNISGTNIDVMIESAWTGGFSALGLYPASAPQYDDFHTDETDPVIDLWVSSGNTVWDGNMFDDKTETDASSAFSQVNVESVDGVRRASFRRPLATGDGNDQDIPAGDIVVGYSCHQTNTAPPNEDVPKHQGGALSCYGVTTIDFTAPQNCEPAGDGSFIAPGGDFSLNWEPVDVGVMQFTMSAPTTGYLSFGIGTGGHSNMDTYVGWVSGGTPTLLDQYSTSKSAPINDGSNDLTIVSSDESGGTTTIVFTRPYLTGDASDTDIIDTAYVLSWATRADDGSGTSFQKHTKTGMAGVNFLGGNGTVALPDDEGSGGAAEGGVFVAPGGVFTLTWDVVGDAIEFEMTAPSTGYLAFGFGSGAHVGMDTYVGWVDGGETVLLDQMSSGFSIPESDDTNDATLIDSSEADGTTTISFSRPLVTGDATDVDITDTTFTLSWAVVDTDGTGETYDQHSDKYGTSQVNFLTGGGGSRFAGRSAAFGVNCVVVVVFTIWVVVRWIRKCAKCVQRRARNSEFDHAQDDMFKIDDGTPENLAPVPSHRAAPLPLPSTAAGGDDWVEMGTPPADAPLKPSRGGQYGPSGPSGPHGRNDTHHSTFYSSRYEGGEFGFGGPPPSQRGRPEMNYRGSSYVSTGSNAAVGTDGVDEYWGWDGDASEGDDGFDDFAAGMADRGIAFDASAGDNRRMTLTPAKQIKGRETTSAFRRCCYRRVPGSAAMVADVAVAFVWVLINAVFVVFPFPGGPTVANQFGYLAIANGMYAVIPATRNSLSSLLLGVHFDHTIMYHRWVGRLAVILALLHHVASIVSVGFGTTLTKYKYLMGWVAAMAGYFIIATAVGYLRRNKFNFFFYAHFAFLFWFAGAAFHSKDCRIYVIAATALYLIDRIGRLMQGLCPRKSTLLRVKAGDVVQIQFPKAFFSKYRPGQYVFLNIPTISLLEWHPYTLSSSHLEPRCEVHIKALGDHTRAVLERAKRGGRIRVRVDGPYGKFALNPRRYETVMCFSGGVGVTPMAALTKMLFEYNAAKVPKTRGATRDVYFIWSVRSELEFEWFEEELAACLDISQDPKFPNLHLYCHVTRADEVSNPLLRVGRPDLGAIFNHCEQTNGSGRVACYVCGPSKLVDSVWDTCKKRSNSRISYAIHHEVFDF